MIDLLPEMYLHGARLHIVYMESGNQMDGISSCAVWIIVCHKPNTRFGEMLVEQELDETKRCRDCNFLSCDILVVYWLMLLSSQY